MKIFATIVIILAVGALAYAVTAGNRLVKRSRVRASFYGESYRGKRMANGQRFDPDRFICASFVYPLGAILKVREVKTGRSVIVEVTDRGPAFWTGCGIDLSQRAFARIAPLRMGHCEVSIEVLPNAEVMP